MEKGGGRKLQKQEREYREEGTKKYTQKESENIRYIM